MACGLCSAFYFSAVAPRDWTSPQNDVLWQDEVKTLFDPCPAGWRVPKNGEGELSPWAAFTISNGQWLNTDNTGGRRWNNTVIYGGEAWYIAAGYRDAGDKLTGGTINGINTNAYNWSSTVSNVHSLYLYFSNNSLILNNKYFRARSYSVRCVRE